nr:hypothetical protein [Candidatus Krumholzibacteria bacterium]
MGDQGKLAALLAKLEEGPDQCDQRDAGTILDLAQKLWALNETNPLPRPQWESFLRLTRHPRYLTALADHERRLAWSTLVFAVIEGIGFNLGDLLQQRTEEMPDRVLFQDLKESGSGSWTYAQIFQRVRTIAAVFLQEGVAEAP